MSPQFWNQIVLLAPKLKGPVQLAGLVFSVLCAALIKNVDPANVTSLTVAGAIGVATLVIPLAFDKGVIGYLPERQRGPFLLILLAMLLVSFGALATVTARSFLQVDPEIIRFDAVLDPSKVKIIRRPDGSARVQIAWKFHPLSSHSNNGATVFTGIVVLHDEDKIKEDGQGKKSTSACSQVKSCLGSYFFSNLAESPLLVRSGVDDAPLTTVVDIKSVPKVLRVWWEFYQAEGPGDSHCAFDNRHPSLSMDGVPKLAMYSKGEVVGDLCYRSYSQQSILTAI